MTLKIAELIRKPVTWLIAAMVVLFGLAIFPPGMATKEKRPVVVGPAPAELAEAAPEKPLPAAEPVVTEEKPAVVADAERLPKPMLLPTLGEAEEKAVLEKMATAGGGEVVKEEAMVEAGSPPQALPKAVPLVIMGPPEPLEIRLTLEKQFVGPPPPAQLTETWARLFTGPPSPAAYGPPVAWGLEIPKDGEGEAVDGEFAQQEAAMALAQKPTARITAPPAPEPEPEVMVEQPLPPSEGHSWSIVKVSGRDYVTADSIQKFYGFSTHKVEGKHVWFRMTNLILKGTIGGQELLINNIKFILSYPVISSGGKALFSRLDLCKLIDPVLRPSYNAGGSFFDTVVIDAGHGGHDSGSKGVYGYEKNYALSMALVLREVLLKRGFKVVMTRSNDTFLTLSNRVEIANRTPNSIFISLHFNSGQSAASGIETFALTPQGSASSLARGGGFSNTARVGNQFDSENITLATAVHAQVVHRFKLIDRGIKRARWTVLTGCKRPGILFEGGFVTNAKECQLIASESYRKAVCDAIGDAVVNYRAALNPKLVRGQR